MESWRKLARRRSGHEAHESKKGGPSKRYHQILSSIRQTFKSRDVLEDTTVDILTDFRLLNKKGEKVAAPAHVADVVELRRRETSWMES